MEKTKIMSAFMLLSINFRFVDTISLSTIYLLLTRWFDSTIYEDKSA